VRISERGGFSAGELLDEILRPDPGGPRIHPTDLDIGPADTGGLDRSRGSVPGMPQWLVVLEVRVTGPPKYDPFERPGTRGMIDADMADQSIARLTGVARDGDAAAGLAGRLRATPEGQQVLAWLRAAVAQPAGDRRTRAVMYLVDSVCSYLLLYPQDTAALQQALQPAANHLSVPGFDQLA
jgi:hypothetical protein